MNRDHELQQIGERLHVLTAMAAALRRPQDLLQLVAESGADEAVNRLRTEWDMDEHQAHAVLDLHVRRFTVDFVARITDEIADLERARDHLTGAEVNN